MFDYDDQTTNPDAIIGVADEIRATPPPPSDEERWLADLDRQNRIEANRVWHNQLRLERESAQAEAKAAAQHEAALAAAQAREKANRALRERRAKEAQQRELASLQLKAARHENWQRSVERYASNAARQQTVDSILGELDQMINPPEPPPMPEPEIVYVENSDRLAPGELPTSSVDFRKPSWE